MRKQAGAREPNPLSRWHPRFETRPGHGLSKVDRTWLPRSRIQALEEQHHLCNSARHLSLPQFALMGVGEANTGETVMAPGSGTPPRPLNFYGNKRREP